jgi:hypothetical protein
MIKQIFLILLFFTLLFIGGCGSDSTDTNSSQTIIDANLSGDQPPMFPNWNDSTPK